MARSDALTSPRIFIRNPLCECCLLRLSTSHSGPLRGTRPAQIFCATRQRSTHDESSRLLNDIQICGSRSEPDSRETNPADGGALAALYEEQAEALYRMGLSMLGGNGTDAEDFVQETFLQACEAWGGFEGNSKPSTWLYTIARRTGYRMRRRRAGQPRHTEAFDEELHDVETESEADDPLAALIAQEEETRLYEALDALPIRYRLPVSLKELGNLHVSDVADFLHLHEGTVKSRLHRGRGRLAEALASGDPAPAKAGRDASGGTGRSETLCPQCRAVFGNAARADRVCQVARRSASRDDLIQELGVAS